MSKKKAPRNQTTAAVNHGLSHIINGDSMLRGSADMITGLDIRSLILHARCEADIIRTLNDHTSILSSSVYHMVEMANTELRVSARDRDTGVINKLGTKVLREVIQSLDDPDTLLKGFNPKKGIESLNSTLIQEGILTGAVAAELVLSGGDRKPDYLIPIPVETLQWKPRKVKGRDSKVMIPTQRGIDLDYPNIFYCASHQQANTVKPTSMLQPAIGVVSNFSRFMEDLNEVIDISGHSRLTITLDKEQMMKFVPDDCQDDAKKREQWLEGQRQVVMSALAELTPEQALVLWSGQEADILGGSNVKSDYSALLGTLLGILALSLKSNSTLLGLRISGGSQNMSSTESLMAIKVASSCQRPVEEIWARAGNLILRLAGMFNLTCRAKFEPIELRPTIELESHKLIRQTRVLELLSLGIITDEEAAERLGLQGLPDEFEPLSGTGFRESTGDINTAQAVSNSQDPAGRTLTPKDAKGTE